MTLERCRLQPIFCEKIITVNCLSLQRDGKEQKELSILLRKLEPVSFVKPGRASCDSCKRGFCSWVRIFGHHLRYLCVLLGQSAFAVWRLTTPKKLLVPADRLREILKIGSQLFNNETPLFTHWGRAATFGQGLEASGLRKATGI